MPELSVSVEKLKSLAIFAKESGTANINETGVYRTVLSPDELIKDYPNHTTVVDVFERGLAVNPNGPCLGKRVAHFNSATGQISSWSGYVWETYAQIAQRRLDFGRGLQYVHNVLLNLSEKDKWHIGIYSQNKTEWVIADFGAQLFSNVTVALYDTLGPEAAEFILNHAEIPILVTTLDKVGLVLGLVPKCPKLKAIIVIEDNFPSASGSNVAPLKLYKEWANEKGVSVFSFAQVEEFGKNHKIPPRLPKASDLFCICYTSGKICLNSYRNNWKSKGCYADSRKYGRSAESRRFSSRNSAVRCSYFLSSSCSRF
jgi:long-chain acyl-CoA synthetase